MSETITPATVPQGEPTEPTTTPEPTPDAGDTATLAGANKTLRRFGSLCKVQTDYCYGLAETAALYVEQFLGASDKSTRSRAVENLADEWLLWDEDTLALPRSKAMTRTKERVNMLLRVNAVRVLLGDGRDVAKGDGTAAGRGKSRKGTPIPWGKLRELAPLVERDPADNVEQWTALSVDVRDKGVALVAEIAASGLNRRDVVDAVRKIAAEHYTTREASLRAVADANPDNKDAQAEWQRARKQADQWVDKVTDTTPPVTETPEVTPTETTEEQKPQPRAVSLPQMAKEGTAKDVAEMCRELVESNDQPDDVLQALLTALHTSGVLSKRAQRACNAALTILAREEKPTPTVAVAALNGHAVAVA
jgi:hypothetical protein